MIVIFFLLDQIIFDLLSVGLYLYDIHCPLRKKDKHTKTPWTIKTYIHIEKLFKNQSFSYLFTTLLLLKNQRSGENVQVSINVQTAERLDGTQSGFSVWLEWGCVTAQRERIIETSSKRSLLNAAVLTNAVYFFFTQASEIISLIFILLSASTVWKGARIAET